MQLNQLYRHKFWFYVGTMDSLQVFNANNGMRVAIWRVDYHKLGWKVVCQLDALPNDSGFDKYLEEWKTYVNDKLFYEAR